MHTDFRVGPWVVHPHLNTISCNGTTAHLEPKVMAVLVCLAEHAGEALPKEKLLQEVWADTFVADDALKHCIFELRRVLEDDARNPHIIQTIPKRGYRLVAPVGSTNGNAELLSTNAARDVARRWWTAPKPAVVFAIVGLIVLLLWIGLVKIPRSRVIPRVSLLDLQNMKVTKIVDTGNVGRLAISPDGRFIAYSVLGAKQSLWVRQLAPESTPVQVVAPSDGYYGSVRFSADGSYLYFVRDSDGYVVPTLGGMPKRIVHGTFSGIAISPDGKKLAYLVHGGSDKESELVIANADGTDERVIARHARSSGVRFFSRPAPSWSPDGKLIAVSVERDSDTVVNLYSVDGGAPHIVPAVGAVTQVVWLPDQTGLLAAVFPSEVAGQATVPHEIWLLPFPKGTPQKMTHDLGGYRSLSLSGDGKLLAAVRDQVFLSIFVAPASDPDKARPVGPGNSDGIGLKWMPDGTLLVQNVLSEFSLLAPQEKKRTPLFQDQVYPGHFCVCGIGRWIVLMRQNVGGHSTIWRVDAAGRNPKQLTAGPTDFAPQCSPDGKFVIYASESHDTYKLMRVPIDGGTPAVLADSGDIAGLQYSPNGKQIADIEVQQGGKTVLVVRNVETMEITRSFDFSADPVDFDGSGWNLQWSPDGQALTYVLQKNSSVNLWKQSLSGGPPHQITHFPDRIVTYQWSPNGKQVAFTRVHNSRDAILITDFLKNQ